MKPTTSTEIKVGAISLLSLILLVYMFIGLGHFHFRQSGYTVQVVFSQVDGLKEGNVVRYAGVEVGRVQQVTTEPAGVNVILKINEGVAIPQESQFGIGTDGLLGEKYVNIMPPAHSQGMLLPNSVVQGEDPHRIEQIVVYAEQLLQEMKDLFAAFNISLGSETSKTAMSETLLNVRDLTANLKAMSATLAQLTNNNAAPVSNVVQQLKALATTLNILAQRVDKMVDTVDNNGQTARDLRVTLQNMRDISSHIDKMAVALEGVVTDPDNIHNLHDTLKHTRVVTEKADKMLGKLGETKVVTGWELLYDTTTGRYNANADMKINTSSTDFFVIGADSLGDSSKSNIQIGKGDDHFATRMGIVDSKAGVGWDTQLGKQTHLALDVYDPNDVHVKLRALYQIAPDTFIVTQADNLTKQDQRQVFFGMRQVF